MGRGSFPLRLSIGIIEFVGDKVRFGVSLGGRMILGENEGERRDEGPGERTAYDKINSSKLSDAFVDRVL